MYFFTFKNMNETSSNNYQPNQNTDNPLVELEKLFLKNELDQMYQADQPTTSEQRTPPTKQTTSPQITEKNSHFKQKITNILSNIKTSFQKGINSGKKLAQNSIDKLKGPNPIKNKAYYIIQKMLDDEKSRMQIADETPSLSSDIWKVFKEENEYINVEYPTPEQIHALQEICGAENIKQKTSNSIQINKEIYQKKIINNKKNVYLGAVHHRESMYQENMKKRVLNTLKQALENAHVYFIPSNYSSKTKHALATIAVPQNTEHHLIRQLEYYFPNKDISIYPQKNINCNLIAIKSANILQVLDTIELAIQTTQTTINHRINALI